MSDASRALSDLDLSCLWHPLLQHRDLEAGPRLIDRGEGCYVFDADGNRWLDGVSGLWCVNVGHGREELADVAREQMARLAYAPLTMSHAPAIRLAAKLIDWLGYPGKVYFSNSGSEANEAAFKIARQYHAQTGSPGRTKIIARHRGYHGARAMGRWRRSSSTSRPRTPIAARTTVPRHSSRRSCARALTASPPS